MRFSAAMLLCLLAADSLALAQAWDEAIGG
jgi:hypothetical protein